MQRRWALGGTFLGLMTAGVAACQLLAGIDDRSVYVADAADLPDTGPVPDAAGQCRGADVPAAPDISTSSPSDPLDFVAVLARLHLGVGPDAGGPYGFNLDRTCTCPEKDSCVRGLAADGGKLPPACDGVDGIDNSGLGLFELFAKSNLISEATFNDALGSGASGVFIRIRGYNGQPDDAQVQVSVYSSRGFSGYPDAGPKFDGNDVWLVDDSSITNGNVDAPKYTTASGYVRGGVLVATLKFPIVVGSKNFDPIVIELQSGMIVARLDVVAQKLVKLSGRVAGRWEASKMLTSLQALNDPLQAGQHLCGTDPTYQVVKPKICEYVDITADPTDDGTGVCNALSMALGFEAAPAKFGAVTPPVKPSQPCGANWSDSCQ